LRGSEATVHSGGMSRLLIRLIINSIALWLTTLILNPHVWVEAFAPGDTFAVVLTYLLVALIFGVVNGVIGNFIRIVAFPVYILTLGLIALVVNALLLLLVSWISGLLGFGLHIEDFWWGLLGAVVLALLSWIIGIILRPFVKKR
jgi:putative membrane protein